jgi:hypothetical protein
MSSFFNLQQKLANYSNWQPIIAIGKPCSRQQRYPCRADKNVPESKSSLTLLGFNKGLQEYLEVVAPRLLQVCWKLLEMLLSS